MARADVAAPVRAMLSRKSGVKPSKTAAKATKKPRTRRPGTQTLRKMRKMQQAGVPLLKASPVSKLLKAWVDAEVARRSELAGEALPKIRWERAARHLMRASMDWYCHRLARASHAVAQKDGRPTTQPKDVDFAITWIMRDG
jgi:histone H3/H4